MFAKSPDFTKTSLLVRALTADIGSICRKEDGVQIQHLEAVGENQFGGFGSESLAQMIAVEGDAKLGHTVEMADIPQSHQSNGFPGIDPVDRERRVIRPIAPPSAIFLAVITIEFGIKEVPVVFCTTRSLRSS